MRKKQTTAIKKESDILLHIIFIIIALCCILPFLLIVIISLTEESEIIQNGYSFFPKKISFEAYRYLLMTSDTIATGYKNSFIVIIIGTIIKLFAAGMYGYAISRKDFPFRKTFGTVVLITILFSGGLTPYYYMIVKILKLKNTLWALILPGITIGFDAFMLKSFYVTNVPYEIIESAKMDGVGEGRTFFQIVAPMCIPMFATIALRSAIAYWNQFQPSLLYIDKSSLYTIQYSMQRALNNLNALKALAESGANVDVDMSNMPGEGMRMAMAVFAVGPIILAYPFFQRFFIKGLSVGAVKG